MNGTKVAIYVTVADTARLKEAGHEPKAWARDLIKRELARLDEPQLAPLSDEENQLLEESVGERSELPHDEPNEELADDWLARLRHRAYPNGVEAE